MALCELVMKDLCCVTVANPAETTGTQSSSANIDSSPQGKGSGYLNLNGFRQ